MNILKIFQISSLCLMAFGTTSRAERWVKLYSCDNRTTQELLAIDQDQDINTNQGSQAVIKGEAAEFLLKEGVKGTKVGASGELIIGPMWRERHSFRYSSRAGTQYELLFRDLEGSRITFYWKDGSGNSRQYDFHGCSYTGPSRR